VVREALAVAFDRHVTVREPVANALWLPAARRSQHGVDHATAEILDLLGLDAYREAFVGDLSLGIRRMVDLGCLLAHGPQVALLDEPAAGLAADEADRLVELLRRLRDEAGKSLIVIDHHPAILEAACDRLVALDLGRVIVEGSPGDVLGHPDVAASYLGTARVPSR
jgi:branched-chain amino acid transport system ATP-binding protein